ncbi:response regulator receiver domain-containing protein [Nonomuraea fuscirosea]|uniref:Response regulator receiver domain-containing protein n=1 Tax=Nonomuraea fuscirosea TaxID=1291556 RepID=A0A2T0N4N2_9ACTN|nr:response regulator receiver domain-containing protein [Nonomuraea fuscirosea]
MAANSPLVLVVDDEPNIRELLLDALELNGFRVRTAASGTQARWRARGPSSPRCANATTASRSRS